MQEYTQERINQAERRGVEFPTDVKEQISEYANPVSYTHLDVYKRQSKRRTKNNDENGK